MSNTSEAERCLKAISRAAVDNYINDSLTVGELVCIASGMREDERIHARGANSILKDHGLMVQGERLLIANTYKALSEKLSTTIWASGWRSILIKHPLAELLKNSVRFSDGKSRVVSIPIEIFISI